MYPLDLLQNLELARINPVENYSNRSNEFSRVKTLERGHFYSKADLRSFDLEDVCLDGVVLYRCLFSEEEVKIPESVLNLEPCMLDDVKPFVVDNDAYMDLSFIDKVLVNIDLSVERCFDFSIKGSKLENSKLWVGSSAFFTLCDTELYKSELGILGASFRTQKVPNLYLKHSSFTLDPDFKTVRSPELALINLRSYESELSFAHFQDFSDIKSPFVITLNEVAVFFKSQLWLGAKVELYLRNDSSVYTNSELIYNSFKDPGCISLCRPSQNIYLNQTYVENIEFSGIDFTQCTFQKYDPRLYYLERTSFKNCDFRDACFYKAYFDDVWFEDCILDKATQLKDSLFLFRAETSFARKEARDLGLQILEAHSEVEGFHFIDVGFADLDLRGVTFRNCVFKDQVSFFNTDLKNAQFINCEFKADNTGFDGADLSGVKFEGCVFGPSYYSFESTAYSSETLKYLENTRVFDILESEGILNDNEDVGINDTFIGILKELSSNARLSNELVEKLRRKDKLPKIQGVSELKATTKKFFSREEDYNRTSGVQAEIFRTLIEFCDLSNYELRTYILESSLLKDRMGLGAEIVSPYALRNVIKALNASDLEKGLRARIKLKLLNMIEDSRAEVFGLSDTESHSQAQLDQIDDCYEIVEDFTP